MGIEDYKVPIVLDRERHLFFSLDAMRKFEEQTGINFLQGFKGKKLGADLTAKLLWACLVHEDKELTVDDVGTMVHMGNLQEVLGKLTKAIRIHQGGAEDSPPFGSSSGQ